MIGLGLKFLFVPIIAAFVLSSMILFEYRSIDSSPTPSTDQSGDLNTANSSASRLLNTLIDNNQTLFPLSNFTAGSHQYSTTNSLSVKDSNATNLAQKQELISSYIQQHQPSSIQPQPNQQIPLAQQQLQLPLNQSQPQSYTNTSFLMQQQPFAGLQKQSSQPYPPPMQQQQPLQQQPQQNQPLTQPYPSPPVQQQQWLTYREPGGTFMISYPSNWISVPGENGGIMFKAPAETFSDSDVNAAVLIMSDTLPSMTNTLQAMTEYKLKSYSVPSPNDKVILSQGTSLAGLPAHMVIVEFLNMGTFLDLWE